MADRARSLPGIFFGFLLFGCSLFLVLEASARVYLFGLAGLVPRKIDSLRLIWDAEFVQPSLDPAIAFELRPNLDTYYKLVRMRTNSRGLRDAEYSIEVPGNTFRVAVVGSSFALPVGVELDSAFHSLLEDWLSREDSDIRYEFINFSCAAYHPSQLVATLVGKALDYDPDLILFTTTRLSAPLLLESARRAIPEYIPSPRTYPFFRSFFVTIVEQKTGRGPQPGSLWDKRTGLLERMLMTVPPPGRGSRHPSEQPGGEGDNPGPNVLQKLAEIRATTGIPIVVLRLGMRHVRSEIDSRIEEQARALGISYLDTRPAFDGTRASDFWIYALDPHPNAAAHEIFARLIVDYLRSNRLLEGRK